MTFVTVESPARSYRRPLVFSSFSSLDEGTILILIPTVAVLLRQEAHAYNYGPLWQKGVQPNRFIDSLYTISWPNIDRPIFGRPDAGIKKTGEGQRRIG